VTGTLEPEIDTPLTCVMLSAQGAPPWVTVLELPLMETEARRLEGLDCWTVSVQDPFCVAWTVLLEPLIETEACKAAGDV